MASLQDIIASRRSIYDPQRQLVQQQIGALPGQQQAELAGLDQAKDNAFGDINKQANSNGMFFSGFRPSEQAKYVGATYLPARAQVANTYASNRSKLEAALLGIGESEMNSAQDIYQKEQDRAAAERAARASAQSSALNLAALQRQAAPQPQLDPVSVARGFAKNAKAQLAAAGNIKPFAREAVLKDLITAYGLDPKTAQQIVYKEIFPDGWDGVRTAPKPASKPSIMPGLQMYGNARKYS